jgi:hypothetical protein
MRCSYKYEFPNFDYDIPQLPDGFVDVSWHNDVCPSFSCDLNETQEMVLWVNYADENRRECGGLQFALVVKDKENDFCDPFDFASELETNSWDDILIKIKFLRQKVKV